MPAQEDDKGDDNLTIQLRKDRDMQYAMLIAVVVLVVLMIADHRR